MGNSLTNICTNSSQNTTPPTQPEMRTRRTRHGHIQSTAVKQNSDIQKQKRPGILQNKSGNQIQKRPGIQKQKRSGILQNKPTKKKNIPRVTVVQPPKKKPITPTSGGGRRKNKSHKKQIKKRNITHRRKRNQILQLTF